MIQKPGTFREHAVLSNLKINNICAKDARKHWEKIMLKELKTLIELWEKSGRIAFHRPRKKNC